MCIPKSPPFEVYCWVTSEKSNARNESEHVIEMIVAWHSEATVVVGVLLGVLLVEFDVDTTQDRHGDAEYIHRTCATVAQVWSGRTEIADTIGWSCQNRQSQA